MSRSERVRRQRRRERARTAGLAVLAFASLVFALTMFGLKEKAIAIEEETHEKIVTEDVGPEETGAGDETAGQDDTYTGPEPVPAEEQEEPMTPDEVVTELVAYGYYRDDVPLEYELQDCLHLACQESGVPYALALAVIQKETEFQNLHGDDGVSEGYMQVQRKWHYDRMERLGVEDLMEPAGNFRVGCDFLAELLGKYPMQEALTAYNSGSPGYNDYSYVVMEYYEEWKELVGDDVSGIKG